MDQGGWLELVGVDLGGFFQLSFRVMMSGWKGWDGKLTSHISWDDGVEGLFGRCILSWTPST